MVGTSSPIAPADSLTWGRVCRLELGWGAGVSSAALTPAGRLLAATTRPGEPAGTWREREPCAEHSSCSPLRGPRPPLGGRRLRFRGRIRPSQVPRFRPRSWGPTSVRSPSQSGPPVGRSVGLSPSRGWGTVCAEGVATPLGGLGWRAPCGPPLPSRPNPCSRTLSLALYCLLPGLRRAGSGGHRGGRGWGSRGFPGARPPRTEGSPAPPAGGSRVRGAKRRSINFSAQKSMLLSGRRSMPAQPGGAPPGLGPGAGRPGSGAAAGACGAALGGCRPRPQPRGAHSARAPLAPPCGLS